MKWALPTGSSKSSWKLKAHRSTRSFVGTATLWGQAGAGEEHKDCASGTAGPPGPQPLGSPGRVDGPVGVLVADPGVAGQAARHHGVMWPTLAAELQVPGGGGPCKGPVLAEAMGTRALEGGSALRTPQPTHASRQTDDFTRALVRAFLQRSI